MDPKETQVLLEQMDRISQGLDKISKKLEAIETDLERVKTAAMRMDSHIESVETVYAIVRRPFGRMVCGLLPEMKSQTSNQSVTAASGDHSSFA